VGQANLKALGYTNPGNWKAYDSEITFGSSDLFDFVRSDGVEFAEYDFVTVAAHEIGHALGFTSVVEDFGGQYVAPLDLFRFAKGSSITPGNFTAASRNLVNNTPAIFSDGAFSAEFASGTAADGFQPSHWKNTNVIANLIGIMNPTITNGVFYDPGQADFRALDVLGYDVNWSAVPEISSLSAGGLLLLGLLQRRRGAGAHRVC
jgi:hypothetical protein